MPFISNILIYLYNFFIANPVKYIEIQMKAGNYEVAAWCIIGFTFILLALSLIPIIMAPCSAGFCPIP